MDSNSDEIPTFSVATPSQPNRQQSGNVKPEEQKNVSDKDRNDVDKIFESEWNSFYLKPKKKSKVCVQDPEEVPDKAVEQTVSESSDTKDFDKPVQSKIVETPTGVTFSDVGSSAVRRPRDPAVDIPDETYKLQTLPDPVSAIQGGIKCEISGDDGYSSQGYSFRSPTALGYDSEIQLNKNVSKDFTSWCIYNYIQQRECCVYIKDINLDNGKCQCGREEEWHVEKGLNISPKPNLTKWDSDKHTHTLPCECFGEVLFRGFGNHSHKNAPYMRVDSACDMENVWQVLMDCWRLPVPKLLISVTGGAKRFSLRPRLKTILKQGLINAAVSTGAWIITGGTAAGVMEFVGEAVQDHMQAVGDPDSNPCVALGIASWGIIANNLALDGDGERGLFPALYSMQDVCDEKAKSVPLDHNHTHFLLVDNGTERKYGVEIEFRSRLESYISQKVETGVTECQSVNVPHVVIVVEGGINTMKTVYESITCNTPVLVVDGSGRAADLIAEAYRLTKNINDEDMSVYPVDFEETMVSKARAMFEWKKDTSAEVIDRNIRQTVECLKGCLEERKLMNVFNLDKADSVQDIDRAILYALLKANKANANSQLSLALAWNRCDIARQEIFTVENRNKWQQEDLYNAMFTALVQNRVDFVQLFLDNGVDLKRFLTTRTLWNLYCNCVIDPTDAGASMLRYLISNIKQTWASVLLCRGTPDFENFPDLLPCINTVIVHLLRDQNFSFYTAPGSLVLLLTVLPVALFLCLCSGFMLYSRTLPFSPPQNLNESHTVVDESPSMTWKGDIHLIKSRREFIQSEKNVHTGEILTPREMRRKSRVIHSADFEHPERELFIWAVLFNRRELTHFFWRSGEDHLGGALFASALLYRLSQLANSEEEAELGKDMSQHSDECEEWAVGVLLECYKRNKHKTHKLLVRDLPHWGGVTLFSLAEAYQLMEFAEQSACQTKLSSIWKGNMALYTSQIKIFWCTFLPIFIPFIKFKVNSGNFNDKRENFLDEVDTCSDDDTAVSSGAFKQRFNRVEPLVLPDDDNDGLGFVKSRSRRESHILASKLRRVNVFDVTTDNISIFRAIYYFYQAPVTKFFCNLLSYIAFMILFSFTVLVKLAPIEEDDSPSVQEYLTWAWLSTLIVEEIKQILANDQYSTKYKFYNWCRNGWNYFDGIMYLLFLTSIVLRYVLSRDDFVWARVFYSITLALFSLRFMQFFYVERTMGPKIIMIRKMLKDFLFFFLILLVFVISFGMAYHANMFPQSPASWSIVANVLYFPYFQMYGELFLEDMKGDEVSGCTRNETIWREDLTKRCPTENMVAPTLLAVYMIITNILLVNLLIAMFSYSFQAVHENSTKVWCYNRLALVFEYFERPAFAPPLIIISHLIGLGKWITHFCLGKCRGANSFHKHLTEAEHQRLTAFEKVATDHYLSLRKQQSAATLDFRVVSTVDSLKHVMKELEMIKESLQQPDSTRSNVASSPPYSADPSQLSRLQRERELMNMPPLVVKTSTNRSVAEPQYQADEVMTLNDKVDRLAGQMSTVSVGLS